MKRNRNYYGVIGKKSSWPLSGLLFFLRFEIASFFGGVSMESVGNSSTCFELRIIFSSDFSADLCIYHPQSLGFYMFFHPKSIEKHSKSI